MKQEEGFPPSKTVKWEIRLPTWDEEEQKDSGIGQDWEVTDCAPSLSDPPFLHWGNAGRGEDMIGSFGTGSQWHQPSGLDNGALGGSRREPWPKGAVGRPEEAVGGETLQQGLWKEKSPSKALFSVCTVRQDLFRDNIFPHSDSSGIRCKRGWSKALLRGSLPN